MEVKIQATQGICTEFKGENGRKKEVTVVISPLKVTSNQNEDKLSISMGCNMWKSCHHGGCYYSLASRRNKE